jgi:hypothetical protein
MNFVTPLADHDDGRPSYEEKPISAEREPIAAAQDIITNRVCKLQI